MAISINWVTKVIYIPQNYLTPSSGRYILNIETLRNDLKNIEDSDEGLPYPDTHRRNAPVTLAGVVYTQTFEILAPYTISFENTGTPYTVVVEGGNHNIGDVTNFDGGVSMIIGNSAGLIVNTVNIGGGVGTVAEVADAVWNAVSSSFNTSGTTGAKLNSAGNSGDPWATDLSTYATPGTAGYELKGQKTFQTDISAQVQSITPSSTAIHTTATGFTLTQGVVVSGTYTDTHTYDEAEHYIRDNAGSIDFYYSFNIGTNTNPTNFHFSGYVADKHEVLKVYAYDWGSTQYEQIGEITGYNTIANFSWALYDKHADAGGNVRIRFTSTVVSDLFAHIDQIYVGYIESAPTAAVIADAVRTELTPELTHLMLMENGMTAAQATMLTEIYRLYGLDPTKPLIVTDTSRTAGAGLTQNITSTPTQTTVQRV